MKLMNPDPAGGNGGGAPEWLGALPETMRGDESLKTIPDVPTLAKNYVEARKFIGSKRLEAPQPNWTPDKWAAFNKEIGVPEGPDKYEMPQVTLAEGLKLDDGRMKTAKEMFHKLGLRGEQAKGVLEYYMNDLNAVHQASAAARAKEQSDGEAALKAKWGASYDKNVAAAKTALSKLATPEFLEHLDKSGLGNHPAMVEMWVKVGENLKEDSAGGRGAGSLDAQDAERAKTEIARLRTDEAFQKAYRDAVHPGHKEAVERLYKLNQQAHGTQPVGQA